MLNKKTLFLTSVLIYLFVTGLTFGALKVFGSHSQVAQVVSPVTITPAGSKFKIDPSLPKDQACPLNGQMYTSLEKAVWEKRRPLGVMIENHQDARPQSGLSYSDIVYEAVAEGGITRFLSVFYCGASATDVQVGPVRSARTYFVDFISEYGNKPLYTHVGGANTPGPANALGQLDDYGWSGVNDMNQFSVGFPTFWRDYERLGHEVATEHTMYSTTEKLWNYAAKDRHLTNVDDKGVSWDTGFTPYTFKNDAALAGRPATASVSFSFWPGYGAYEVKWVYDKAGNSYKRFNGGQPHIDRDNNQQLTTKNIAVLFMAEKNANDGYPDNAHLLYGDKGTGNAKVFMDGTEIDAKWSKKTRTDHIVLTNADTGKEISFDRGRIWFEILPVGNKVSY
ncbi:MAG: DUF3048 domain-containing protein [Patescibacteria group bacterium]|nr:DUF3048 domain-containing protein [Patescibacteria group bacterium]